MQQSLMCQRMIDDVANLRIRDDSREGARRTLDELFHALQYHLVANGYTAQHVGEVCNGRPERREPHDRSGMQMTLTLADATGELVRGLRTVLYDTPFDGSLQASHWMLDQVTNLLDTYSDAEAMAMKVYNEPHPDEPRVVTIQEGALRHCKRLQIAIEDDDAGMIMLQNQQNAMTLREHVLKHDFLEAYIQGVMMFSETLEQSIRDRNRFWSETEDGEGREALEQELLQRIHIAYTQFDRSLLTPSIEFEDETGIACPTPLSALEDLWQWPRRR